MTYLLTGICRYFGLSSLQDDDVIDYRVPNTPTILRFYLQTTTIEQQDMARTFLQTQIEIRRYITTHYQAANDVLFRSDDPYMSKSEFTGCFFAVGHYPLEDRSQLTYGMVDNVLKGMWEFLYRGGRFVAAEFYVVDEHLGTVGIGLVEKDRPSPNPRNATEA